MATTTGDEGAGTILGRIVSGTLKQVAIPIVQGLQRAADKSLGIDVWRPDVRDPNAAVEFEEIRREFGRYPTRSEGELYVNGIDPVAYMESAVQALERRDELSEELVEGFVEDTLGGITIPARLSEYTRVVISDASKGAFVQHSGTFTTAGPKLVDRLASLLPGMGRLRKRGKVTNTLRSLSTALGGDTTGWYPPREEDRPDWWLPDLTGTSDARRAISWLRVWSNHSIRVTATGVTTPVARSPPALKVLGSSEPEEFFYWLEVSVGVGGRKLRIIPELLARLSTYAALRPRNLELLMTLRSRSLEWVKTVQLPYQDAALVLPGTIAMACLISKPEAAAIDLLGSRAMEFAVQSTLSVQQGYPELALTWAESTRKWLARAVPSVGRDDLSSPWSRKVLFPRGA